jgi:hypothetical protein
MYCTYSPLSSTHLWLCCSNLFNASKTNSFGYAGNKKIENRKSQRLISTHMYSSPLLPDGHVLYVPYFKTICSAELILSYTYSTYTPTHTCRYPSTHSLRNRCIQMEDCEWWTGNNLKVQSQHSATETEENYKNFGHDTWLMGWDQNPEPPKYEVGVSCNDPWHSMTLQVIP